MQIVPRLITKALNQSLGHQPNVSIKLRNVEALKKIAIAVIKKSYLRYNFSNQRLISKIRRTDGANSHTIRRRFEQRKRQLLKHDADIEVNETGARNVDVNSLHRKPKKQLLRRNSGQGGDLAVTESAGDVAIVMQLALELGIASLIQIYLESAGLVIKAEVAYVFREETNREAVGFQRFVYRLRRRGIEFRFGSWD